MATLGDAHASWAPARPEQDVAGQRDLDTPATVAEAGHDRPEAAAPVPRARRRARWAVLVTVATVALTVLVLDVGGDIGREAVSAAPTDGSSVPAGAVAPVAPRVPVEGPVQERPGADPVPAVPAAAPADPPTLDLGALVGDGTFDVADGGTAWVGVGRTWTYQVEVERGLPFPVADVSREVDAILTDSRSWARGGVARIQRVPAGATSRIVLASPATTDRLCAPLQTLGELSCRSGNMVVLNAKRWAVGSDNVPASLSVYRAYLVNHEVGHALGFGHEYCNGPGAVAPVMQQQTKGLDGCRPNGWPFPAAG